MLYRTMEEHMDEAKKGLCAHLHIQNHSNSCVASVGGAKNEFLEV